MFFKHGQTCGVLFVLPWLRRDTDQCLEDTPGFEQFFKLVGKVIPGYAVMTLKQTPGMWKDDVVVEKIRTRQTAIAQAITKYKPGCVVFLGINFAKYCVPEFKNARHNITGTFAEYSYVVNDKKKKIMSLAWMAPDKIMEDPFEFVRMPETLSKLWFLAKKKRYEAKPVIENLDTYKAATEYVDFLAYEHTGMIGFDTETYSLNRVHNQRLGSMQFCTDAYDSKVLLWDSKHQAMSKRELDKLHPKLAYLFGSNKTKLDAWIMHNNQFDEMQIFSAFGCRMPKTTFDTVMFAYLMDESRKYNARLPVSPDEGPYSLKILVKEFLAFFHYNAETMKARSDGTLMELPLPEFLEYSGFDPIVTWRMFDVFLKWAKTEKYAEKALNLMRYLCSPSSKMYADMSRNGMHVDGDKLRSLLSRNSVINARLASIKEAYKAIPEIVAINKEMFHEEAKTVMCFKTPWIFNMKKDTHKKALFFHSKKGYKLPANKDGKYSTDKKFQKLHDKNPAVALLKESNGLAQLRNLYIRPIFNTMFAHPDPKADTCDGRVHTQIRMHGTVTGRVTCIAKGTLIETVRDASEYPKGVKIENVKVGDFVYCYDKNGKPTIREVVSAGKTGHKHVVRIHWQGSGHKHTGHLDLTPEHRVRLTSGKYVRADSLTYGDRVMAMSRDAHKDQRLYFTGLEKPLVEHRFVWDHFNKKKFPGTNKWHIHHDDGNHYNNTPQNLVLLSNSAHASAHGSNVSEEKRNAHRAALAARRASGERVGGLAGEASRSYWKATRFELLRLLFKCGGVVSKCRKFNVDFNTFKAKLAEHKIDWKTVALRFGADGRYVSKYRASKYVGVSTAISERELRVPTRRMKVLFTYYKLPYGALSKKSTQPKRSELNELIASHRKNNHEVLRVVKLKKAVDVYDITVKGCHNFIANEICVHNCQHPNTAQIPRSDTPEKKEIKSLFSPELGKVYMQCDLASAEVRVLGGISGDVEICRLSQEAFEMLKQARANPDDKKLKEAAELHANFHKQTYALCYGIAPDQVTGPQRQIAKNTTFGICYQMSDNGLAAQLGVSVEEAIAIKKTYFGIYKGADKWINETKDFVRENGYVETPIGRRRRVPQIFTGERKFMSEAERYAVNAPIQGTASDYAMLATMLLNKAIIEAGVEVDVKLINGVYDSAVVEVTATVEWVEYVAKLMRKIFTVDVVKYLIKYFSFELKAPIDIDIEISQWKQFKCKACGAKRYPGEGKTCSAKLKTGKKKEDGTDETKPCGCNEYEVLHTNGGWGYLMPLEENKQGYMKAAKGF